MVVKVNFSYHLSCFNYFKKNREGKKLEANVINIQLMIWGEGNSMCVVFVILFFFIFRMQKFF